MTCRELVDFLSAYLDRELPQDERARFDAHLAECPECVRYLTSYEATIALARGAVEHPDDPVPAAVPDELVRAILESRRRG